MAKSIDEINEDIDFIEQAFECEWIGFYVNYLRANAHEMQDAMEMCEYE